jgi:transcriptional regulator with XRE-family HTH domain
MAEGSPHKGAAENDGYAKAVGARLRAVRKQQQLSLYGVEIKSRGRWKAVVVGSYERGDRAVSARRLSELADFYGVPVGDLLPPDRGGSCNGGGAPSLSRVVLNLDKVAALSDQNADALKRFVVSIQRQRGGPTNRILGVRHEDLRTLALMYDSTITALTKRLGGWQVLVPDSVITDDHR